MNLTIDKMTPADWPAVRTIYLEGIATGNATFEIVAPEWEQWNAIHLEHCRLVARNGLGVLGWAALPPVSRRQVYAGVAEVSVYVAAHVQGLGIGTRLLESLIQESEMHGLWTLQAGIFPENTASIARSRSAPPHRQSGGSREGYCADGAQKHESWNLTRSARTPVTPRIIR